MGYFGYNIDNTCQLCKDTCRSCTQADECTSCYDGLFLYKAQCITPCPLGMYGNVADNTCRNCHETCLHCDGGLDSQCTKCGNTRYLSAHPVGYCKIECPVGQYGHKVERECRDCHSGCAMCVHNCNGDYTECHIHCQQCEYPKYLDHNNNCVGQCPEGYYHSDTPYRTCESC
jgi:proprotein convertase subtilisin/kexin type 5